MNQRRNLQIRGGHNFRDLGGYATQDRRTVKWRTVFRSGVMATIDDRDVEALRGLGIVTICDFRTNSERLRRPTTWHDRESVNLVSQDYEMSAGVLQTLVHDRQAGTDTVRRKMVETYRKLPEEQANNYTMLFRQLTAGLLPLVFNCSAGKDRTGVAAALILSSLGVPRTDIVDDYLLTNDTIDDLVDIIKENRNFGQWVADRPDVAYPLLRAEAEYLDAMFDAVETEYGGVEGYLTTRLGVTTEEIETIRSFLLE